MADADPKLQADVSTWMERVLAAQRSAFNADLPVREAKRRERLDRVIALLLKHGEALTAALSEDFGHRSRHQSMLTDINASIRPAKHAKKHLARWMKAEKRPVDFPLGLLGAKARVEYQPKGVIGIIAPWNFPVNLTFGPLVGALAAGNRAMIKTSEFTPATSALIAAAVAEFFDESEVAVFGGGPEVGQAFAKLPFDHLIFTGATGIGKHILHAAADNLTPVTLELGGKSPTIIGRSADVKATAERIALGKMLNAGQICLAPDYLLVPEEKEEEVVGEVKRAVSVMYPKLIDNDDYTSIINGRHRDRLKGYIEDAVAKGAEAIEVNPGGEDFSNTNSNKLPLTILRRVTDDMQVMQEEIFGPVLPVKTYKSTEDAVQYVNDHDRPLGLYYFGQDEGEQRRVLDRTISGGVTVNDVVFHVSMEDLPFGGIGPSGMGSYHGADGFKTFSHARSIYTQPKVNIAKLAGFIPPYGKALERTIARDFKA